jgi:predicted NUDIX family NTP pyrophosphohydrolase
MPERSAGLLMFRHRHGTTEVLLVHMGGPFWARKDEGAWSIPKGLCEAGEDAHAAARREFAEETGGSPEGEFIAVGTFRLPSGKQLSAFAVEGDFDLSTFKSNMFTMEWPPRSGRMAEFPEADRAAWFDQEQALVKVTKGQRPIIKALFERLRLPRRS